MSAAGGAGRCLCGAVRYEFDGAPKWQALCHCESCRRATSAPVAGFLCVEDQRLRWSGALAAYASSPGVSRLFCPRCGSPMGYRNAKRPGETDLYAASLNDPAAYRPTFHVSWAERLPWLRIEDDLKKIDGGG
mgnify:CR=1 FL=1